MSRARKAVAAATKAKPVIDLGETDPDFLAEQIIAVAESAQKLLRSRLSTRAIHVLIRDKCGESLETIGKVLNAAADLGSYVKR